jgi:hypothetical protein
MNSVQSMILVVEVGDLLKEIAKIKNALKSNEEHMTIVTRMFLQDVLSIHSVALWVSCFLLFLMVARRIHTSFQNFEQVQKGKEIQINPIPSKEQEMKILPTTTVSGIAMNQMKSEFEIPMLLYKI